MESLGMIEYQHTAIDAVHVHALPSAPWTAASAQTRPLLKPRVPYL